MCLWHANTQSCVGCLFFPTHTAVHTPSDLHTYECSDYCTMLWWLCDCSMIFGKLFKSALIRIEFWDHTQAERSRKWPPTPPTTMTPSPLDPASYEVMSSWFRRICPTLPISTSSPGHLLNHHSSEIYTHWLEGSLLSLCVDGGLGKGQGQGRNT